MIDCIDWNIGLIPKSFLKTILLNATGFSCKYRLTSYLEIAILQMGIQLTLMYRMCMYNKDKCIPVLYFSLSLSPDFSFFVDHFSLFIIELVQMASQRERKEEMVYVSLETISAIGLPKMHQRSKCWHKSSHMLS